MSLVLPKIDKDGATQGQGPRFFPRVVHLSWKNEEVPSFWQESYDNWTKLHPDWKVILWTDRMLDLLVEQEFPERVAKYKAYPHQIMRVDFARYCILQLYGGVYCDLDICPMGSFEPLLRLYESDSFNASVVISESGSPHGSGHSLTNAFMISKPNARFWTVVWDVLQDPYKYSPNWKKIIGPGSRHYKIIFESGPGIINEARKEYHKRFFNGSTAGKTDFFELPRQFVQHTPHWHKKPCTAPGGLVKLLQGGSWHKLDSQIATYADQVWSSRDTWAVVVSAVLLLVVIVLATMLGVQTSQLKKLKKKS